MKLEVGQKVRVKKFEERPEHWAPLMDEYMGRVVTIESFYSFGGVGIEGAWWTFKETDFEPVEETMIKNKIEITKGEFMKAVADVMAEDENTRKLIADMPMMSLVFATFGGKVTRKLFGEKEDE